MGRKRRSITGIIIISAVVFVSACAAPSIKPHASGPEEKFDASINRLVDDLMALQTHTPGELAPAAIMSGSLKSGFVYTRLEEHVMEQLELALRRRHEIYTFSRQNWFEYREGRPLSFSDRSHSEQSFNQHLVVYEVYIYKEEVLGQLNVRVIASDAFGQSVRGLASGTALDFGPGLPADRLYHAEPNNNPYPSGLEERPYRSVDRLAYSLSAELADAYKTGVSVGNKAAAAEEVRVLLYAKPTAGISNDTVRQIEDGLQQAVVDNRGFTCVLSEEDFYPAIRKMDFYGKNNSIFEAEASGLIDGFTTGTVLLMADISKHADGDKIGVALRSIWRVSPLESRTAELIPVNMAGTYLSGFAAKAYVSHSALITVSGGKRLPSTHGTTERKRLRDVSTKPVPISIVPAKPALSQDLDICFFEFGEVYGNRLYTVLNGAPDVTDIRIAGERCSGEDRCLCFDLTYRRLPEELSAWLRKNLRTPSNVVPFTIETKGNDRLEVRFNGGFE